LSVIYHKIGSSGYRRLVTVLSVAILAASARLAGQEMTHVHQATSAAGAWTWRLDGNVFARRPT